MDVSDMIELTIPAKADYIGIVRLTVSGIANRIGFSYDDIEDIKVAVSEAITNAVHHAYKNGETGRVTIQIQPCEDRIDITVADEGQSFDVNKTLQNLKGLDATTSFDQLNEGGLGLYLIDTLMDQVSISGDTGVIVFMTKYLDKGEVERYAGKTYSSLD